MVTSFSRLNNAISMEQSPYSDQTLLSFAKKSDNLNVFKCSNFYSIFEQSRDSGFANCTLIGQPFSDLSPNTQLPEFVMDLNTLHRHLGKPIYFPLVYQDSISYKFLEAACASSWARLPSLTIDGSVLNDNLIQRAASRIGSQVYRRIKNIRRSDIRVIAIAGQQGLKYIEQVEKSSWKHTLQQDMFTRNQIDIYETLLTSPNTLLRVALDDDSPIAYRFDYEKNKILYCLKWSFSEKYRKLSPGFYMLTQDLIESWSGKGIRFVDLFGSPDMLKLSICDEKSKRPRHDFIWPKDSKGTIEQMNNRLMHDTRTAKNLEKGRGIKNLYK